MRQIFIDSILEVAKEYDALILDVREAEYYREGHIKTAVNVPLAEIEDGNFYFDRYKTIIVYCERGASSLTATRILLDRGYDVINTIGGIVSYKGELEKDGGGLNATMI